jgi:hypothetical protein
VGPFKVTAAVGKVAFRLALPDTLSIHNVFHVSLLVPFRGKPPEDGKPLVPLSPFVFEPTDEFLPEEILRHRECRRGTKVVKHYLVTWAGCGPEHISWQPEQYVPSDLVHKYFLKLEAKATKLSRTTLRGPPRRSSRRLRGRMPAFQEDASSEGEETLHLDGPDPDDGS